MQQTSNDKQEWNFCTSELQDGKVALVAISLALIGY